MPWLQILIFLLKYGTSILGLVRGIWELVDWLRQHDDKIDVANIITPKSMKRNLHQLAKNARRHRDMSALEQMRDHLAARKADLEKAMA